MYFVSGCTVPQHQHFLQLQPRRHVFQLRQEPCCDVKLQMQQRLMVPRTGLDCAGRTWFQPVLGRSQEARCPRMPCSAGNSSHLKKVMMCIRCVILDVIFSSASHKPAKGGDRPEATDETSMETAFPALKLSYIVRAAEEHDRVLESELPNGHGGDRLTSFRFNCKHTTLVATGQLDRSSHSRHETSTAATH